MRTKRFDVPIYFGYLNVIVCKNETEMSEVGKKYHPQADTSKYGAFAWQEYNKKGISEYFVALQENVTNHLIVHEVVHLVNYLYLHIGANLDLRNDEHQAYLSAWFFSKIELSLNHKK